VAIFFSTCTSPALSGMFTFAAFVAGHFSADLKLFAAGAPSAPMSFLAQGAYYILPNLELFNARGPAVHGVYPAPALYLLGLIYASLYAGALLAGAVLVFRRREFR